MVGDAPEGFAISPNGNLAVAIAAARLELPTRRPCSTIPTAPSSVLKIDGKKVTKIAEVEVGGLPEGAVFSPNGDYLYVGNFIDQDISILKVDGDQLTDTGQKLKLPGHPASMRGGPQ